MELTRSILSRLEEWKSAPSRKPLLLRGARQTGKTWVVNRFGQQSFAHILRIDFMKDSQAASFFTGSLDPHAIIENLSLYTGIPVDPSDTLLVFDEIQECPQALTSLKYFCEDTPEYFLVATGSYMGISLHEGSPFPVGKVTMMTLYPLTFQEFLQNSGQEALAQRIEEGNYASINQAFIPRLTELLKTYYFVGGMPEAVSTYFDSKDFAAVRAVQNDILSTYDLDFSKHIEMRLLERTRLVWKSLPAQLAKENRRFVYGVVRHGARARDLEECIQWLIDYGIITKVPCLSTFRLPLSAYESRSAFKIFASDVGLLSAQAELSESVLVDGSRIFTEFKGALTEQYVCQQLLADGYVPYYWANPKGNAEIDFVIESGSQVLPIEVKAETNVYAKSLRYVFDHFQLATTVRMSLAGFRKDDWVHNIPLWGAGGLKNYFADNLG